MLARLLRNFDVHNNKSRIVVEAINVVRTTPTDRAQFPHRGPRTESATLTHVESVPVRELRQHASAVLRRVRAGGRVAVTDRGKVTAGLVPPSDAGGAAAPVAAGRVRAATTGVGRHRPQRVSDQSTESVLDALRAEAD